MVLAGLTISNFPSYVNFTLPYLVLLVPGFIISFLGHELAHKFLARRNGLWAEFRTNIYGLMLTAVSAIFPFKFLAPGQVNIQGNGSKEVIGAIGLVGPGFNIALGALLFILSRFSGSFLDQIFLKVAVFNSLLAIINMIPYGSLDGTRVFMWDKTRWAITLASSVVVAVLSYYYLGFT
jgi:Zn-dependent protease